MNEEVTKICEAVKTALEACNIPVMIREPAPDECGDRSCLVIETPVLNPLIINTDMRSKWRKSHAKPKQSCLHFTVGHIHKYDAVGRSEEPEDWFYAEDHATVVPVMLASYIISMVFVEHTNRILAKFYPGVFDK